MVLGCGQGGRRVGQVADLGIDARALGECGRRPEDLGLAHDRRVPRRVGVGEVRPQPDDPHDPLGLRLASGLDQVRPVGQRSPATAQPAVDLEVHPSRRTRLPGRRDHLVQGPSRVDRQVHVRGQRVRPGLPRPDQPGQHPRGRDPRGAQREGLVQQRGAQPGGTPRHGRPGRGQQAVPVSVGLDDRQDLGRGRRSQHLHVGPDRAQVDPGDDVLTSHGRGVLTRPVCQLPRRVPASGSRPGRRRDGPPARAP